VPPPQIGLKSITTSRTDLRGACQSAYKSRIASLEEFQKDRLRAVKALVPADRHPDIDEAIGLCNQGWTGMREMMSAMHMGVPGRGTVGVPPSQGRRRLALLSVHNRVKLPFAGHASERV